MPFVLVLLATIGPSRVAAADIVDRVLAVVDGHLITLSDARAVTELGLMTPGGTSGPGAVLDQLIDRVLILQEVERYAPPEPDPAVIATRLGEVDQIVGSHLAVEARLAALGVSDAWLRQWVRDEFRIRAYVDQRFAGAVDPSEEEIENYFREHPGEFGSNMAGPDAQQYARSRVMASRRQALVTEWLDGLRKRADITKPAR